MPTRYSNTHRLRDVLAHLVTQKRFTGRSGGFLFPQDWARCVGDLISQHARPLRVSKGVLTLAVESTAWMNELQFHVPEILQRVNEVLGEGKIREVRMRLGAWERFHPTLGKRQHGTDTLLDPKDRERLARILRPVRDELLKDQIARAWRRALERKQKKRDTVNA